MRKNFTLLLFMLLFVNFVFSQTVSSLPQSINSKDENSIVIGKIKDNVLVWKENLNTHDNTFLVYDGSLKLIKSVPVSILPKGSMLGQVNVVNKKDSFFLFIQYYNNNNFYSKAAVFNDSAQLVEPVYLLDSLGNLLPNYANPYSFVHSENGKYFGLIKSTPNIDGKAISFKCKIFSDEGNFENLTFDIPQLSESGFFTGPSIDNNMNILFAKWKNLKVKKGTTNITFYKINTNDGLISHVSSTINRKALLGLHLAINSKKNEYLLIGDAYAVRQFTGSLFPIPAPGAENQNLFISSFDSSLNPIKDTMYSYSDLPGINNISSGNEVVLIKPVVSFIPSSNGYALSFAKTPIAKGLSQANNLPFSYTVMESESNPVYTFNEGAFGLKGDNSTVTKMPLNSLEFPTGEGLPPYNNNDNFYYKPVNENNYSLASASNKESENNSDLFVVYLNKNYELEQPKITTSPVKGEN